MVWGGGEQVKEEPRDQAVMLGQALSEAKMTQMWNSPGAPLTEPRRIQPTERREKWPERALQ